MANWRAGPIPVTPLVFDQVSTAVGNALACEGYARIRDDDNHGAVREHPFFSWRVEIHPKTWLVVE